MANVELIGRLEDRFDAVIFLTASDWLTEPRSNRYHYATRFAQRLPVFFVQPDAPYDRLSEEPSGFTNIQLVHCVGDQPDGRAPPSIFRRRRPGFQPVSSAEALMAYFQSKGVRRPLIWIYNFAYGELLRRLPNAFKVYHATEDFSLGEASGVRVDAGFRAALHRGLPDCDLLVAVSETVRDNAVRYLGFEGPAITLPNGCDFDFWFQAKAYDHREAGFVRRLWDGLTRRPSGARILYQGGINDRLDYGLINALAARMPDVIFDFCGPVDESEASSGIMVGWREALTRPNVRYHGLLSSEAVARLARRAAAAIMPFRDTPLIAVSLPLKAYEYLACGLPVVTLPIPALAHDQDNFTFARSAEDYEGAIRSLAPTRAHPQAVQRRLNAARLMDYDRRFEELEATLLPMAAGSRPRTDAPAPLAIELQPPSPPAGSRIVRAWPPSDVICSTYWRTAGADLRLDADGALIKTPPRAWDYAAALPVDLSGLDLSTEWGWLELTIAGVEGEPLVSVVETDDSILLHEGQLAADAGPATYLLDLDSVAWQRLLFRNGDRDAPSSLRLVGAKLLAWPKRHAT